MYSRKTMACRRLNNSVGAALVLLAASGVNVNAKAKSGNAINPPTRAQSSPMTAGERKNLDLVLEWRRDVVEAGHVDRIDRYLAQDYVEHDPNIPPGRAALVTALGKVPAMAKPPVIKIAKGDFIVLVFESQTVDPRDPGKIYHYNDFDLFRIQGGKIAEHWSSSKKLPGSPDFIASNAPEPLKWNSGALSAGERRNIGVATQEHKDILQYGHLDLADKAIAKGYIQHNPNVPQGLDGFKRFMARPAGTPVEAIKTEWKSAPAFTLASGPYVLMMWTWKDKDPADPGKSYFRNHFDLLRIDSGQAQEHWDEARIAVSPPR